MASGHVNRANRPNTWLLRPPLHAGRKTLANPEPSTHGPKRRCAAPQQYSRFLGSCGHARGGVDPTRMTRTGPSLTIASENIDRSSSNPSSAPFSANGLLV